MPRRDGYMDGLNRLPDSIPMEAIDGLLDKSPSRMGTKQLNPDILPPVWFVEYSVDGSTGWHETFAEGDIFMRQRSGTNPWSDAIRIVGEQGAGGGNWMDFRFQRHPDQPDTPTGATPAGWSDAPVAPDGNPLWMTKAQKDEAGALVTAWSTPVRLTGEDGADGAPAPLLIVKFSPDGVNWYDSWVTGRIYMRTSADGGVTWSDIVRIVGETGATGSNGNYADFWFAASLNQPTKPADNVASPSPPWYADPPTVPSGQYLWVTRAYKKADGSCRDAVNTWSAATRLGGIKGDKGDKGDTGTFNDMSWSPANIQAHLAALIANGGIPLGQVGETFVLRGQLAANKIQAGELIGFTILTTDMVANPNDTVVRIDNVDGPSVEFFTRYAESPVRDVGDSFDNAKETASGIIKPLVVERNTVLSPTLTMVSPTVGGFLGNTLITEGATAAIELIPFVFVDGAARGGYPAEAVLRAGRFAARVGGYGSLGANEESNNNLIFSIYDETGEVLGYYQNEGWVGQGGAARRVRSGGGSTGTMTSRQTDYTGFNGYYKIVHVPFVDQNGVAEPFDSVPSVTVTASTTVPWNVHIGVANIDVDGFDVYVWRNNSTSTAFKWIATSY